MQRPCTGQALQTGVPGAGHGNPQIRCGSEGRHTQDGGSGPRSVGAPSTAVSSPPLYTESLKAAPPQACPASKRACSSPFSVKRRKVSFASESASVSYWLKHQVGGPLLGRDSGGFSSSVTFRTPTLYYACAGFVQGTQETDTPGTD